MKHGRVFFSLADLGCVVLSLTGCGASGSFNFGAIASTCTAAQLASRTLTITPTPASVPVGTSVTFTAAGGVAGSSTPTLYIPALADVTPSALGTATPVAGTTASILYTAPASPPIYPDFLIYSESAIQGQVELFAQATNDGGCNELDSGTVSFAITAPTVTAGLSPATASVALGSIADFDGYAVGSVNNGVTWQINGLVNGSATYGTLAPGVAMEIYTAPATMPVTGPSVPITVISRADPTQTATAVVTLH